jgi:polysaccharide biosynthesis transport protein
MNEQKHPAPSEGLGLGDIYFVLFRHKWKIICFSAAGLVTAALIWTLKPVLYGSEAELLVRYVVESRLPRGPGGDSQVRVPDARGENIINSEVEILTSLDLARQVVGTVGAEKILAKAGGGNDPVQAAGMVKRNIIVEPVRRSDVLRIIFQHPDREVVRPVLTQLIASYLRKHAEIHRDLGVSDEFLTQRTMTLSNQLAHTEEQLRNAKMKAGVVSLDDSKKTCTEQIARLRQEIFDAEALLAERESTLKAAVKLAPADSGNTNRGSETSLEKASDYERITTRLNLLSRREQELLTQFTENSAPVKEVRQQMAETERLKKELEEKYPVLANLNVAAPSATGEPLGTRLDPAMEAVQVRGLRSRIESLNSRLTQIRAEASKLEEMEGAIVDLQRKKELEESEYRYFSSSLSQARFNEALEAGKLSNISITQEPSPPFRDLDKLRKLLALVVVGGVLAGIALAFLVEFYLDQTLKRPIEVATRLRLPLFLTIPDTGGNGSQPPPTKIHESLRLKAPEEPAQPGVTDATPEAGGGELAGRDMNNRLHLFFEALRHHLVTFFEDNDLHHKPKLVAVTACAKGAGVTTIAAGLAATLSETGDGNVLLVDMNHAQGTAHPFYRGKPGCGLADVLQDEVKDSALVQEYLYVAAENTNTDTAFNIPKQFTHLMPKLRASNFDYIIFDMPPVSQISVTSKLSRFMDVNLLVVECEKTNREVIKQASSMLAGSKAKVGVVLNKKRTYVPKWLLQEL